MFDRGDNIQYLTQAGIVFLTYLFVMSLFFFVLSPVVDGFFNVYNNLEVGLATDEVQFFGPLFQTACKIILALGVAIPITWFIFWVFNRDPNWERRRYF